MNKGIYIHVPFCVSKCPYCDFYSSPACEEDKNAYVKSVLRTIGSSPFALTADTLFIGGGTPTTLSADALVSMLENAKKRFGLKDAECTVEANPGTVNESFLKRLFDGGFDRISFGVQETHDPILKALGRIHTFKDAEKALIDAERAGFRHISADIMLAVPGQKVSDIKESVRVLSSLPVDHLSAYMLQIEEGTPFFGRVAEPDSDFYAECYMAFVEESQKFGFFQYEISNFAKSPDSVSRHNLHYWRCEEYLGIGPAAHSFIDGRRFYFESDREGFVKSENVWANTVPDGDGGSEEERIMLGLRLCEGIDPASFGNETASRLIKKSKPLISAGLMKYESNRLSLTPRGFLVSNSVISQML